MKLYFNQTGKIIKVVKNSDAFTIAFPFFQYPDAENFQVYEVDEVLANCELCQDLLLNGERGKYFIQAGALNLNDDWIPPAPLQPNEV